MQVGIIFLPFVLFRNFNKDIYFLKTWFIFSHKSIIYTEALVNISGNNYLVLTSDVLVK